MRPAVTYLLSALCLATISCNGTDARRDIPVPRPVAYHRIELPPPVYRTVSNGWVSLQLNSAVTDTVVSAGNSWITACYPDIGATMYITVTELTPATADETIDNRVERIALNTGGNSTEVTSFTTPGKLDARVTVTPAGSPTPVQFLATDHKTVLVSGTVTLEEAATAPGDSIKPIIKMLERDVIYLLDHSTFKNKDQGLRNIEKKR